ncbi:MAG: hypothetical protein AAGD96_14285 [Chloroflexota bacterium]
MPIHTAQKNFWKWSTALLTLLALLIAAPTITQANSVEPHLLQTANTESCSPLTNGDFELGMQGWQSFANSSITAGAAGQGLSVDFGHVEQRGSAVGNKGFILSGVYKMEGLPDPGSGTINWTGVGMDYLSNGVEIEDDAIQFEPNTETDGFRSFSLRSSTPVDTDQFSIWIYSNFGVTLTVDDLVLDWLNCDTDPVPPVPDACNLLLNSGFEQGFTNWELMDWVSGNEITNDAYQGENAISIQSAWIQQRIPAVEGVTYSLQGHYKTDSIAVNWTGVGIDYLNEDGVEIGEEILRLGATTEYTQFDLTGTPPAGTVELAIWLYSSSSVKFLVDEVKLRGDCDSPPPIECQLLLNGDFESLFDSWDLIFGDRYLLGPATSGIWSMSIRNGWIGQGVPGGTSGAFVLKGQYYTQGDLDWTGVGIDFLDASNEEISDVYLQLGPADDFTQFTITGVTPEGAVDAVVWLYSGNSAELIVDDIVLQDESCAD